MKYIPYLLLVINFIPLHTMQPKQIDISDVKEIKILNDRLGYWAQLNDNSIIVVKNAQDKIVATKEFENGGLWTTQELLFASWWFDTLKSFYQRKNVEPNIGWITERFKSL